MAKKGVVVSKTKNKRLDVTITVVDLDSPPDWTKPCGYYGGHLEDVPKPHVRMYPAPKGALVRKRRVKIRLYTYSGTSFGATHWYADVDEEKNPIWCRRVEFPYEKEAHWKELWDDREGEGKRISGHLSTREEALAWAEATCAEEFSPVTHEFYMADGLIDEKAFFPVRFGARLKKPRQADYEINGTKYSAETNEPKKGQRKR